MPYRRRILQYGPGPGELLSSLSERAIAGCWFELRRQGGCGDGELRLSDSFLEREAIQLGDWVACEYDDGERWYLGRVVERTATSPAGVLLKLSGMASQLDTIFPGGYGSEADGAAPHLYGCSELFPADPDAAHANLDCVSRPEDLIRRLLTQYVATSTDITVDESLIEDATTASEVLELKVRGTESATSLLRDLALRSRNASWGVDEQGRFYLLQRRDTVAAEWQEGRDLVSLQEIANEDRVFNRVLLTGGLVYAACGMPPCGVFRWQGNYLQRESRAAHGERRIRLSIPWIRTADDSQTFVREFFRVYAEPGSYFRIEVAQQSTLVRPWMSGIRVLNRMGQELVLSQPESIRVEFDHTPKLQLELGPPDPRKLWATPPASDAWPIAPSDVSGFGGGPVDVTSDGEMSSSGALENSSGSEASSEVSTDDYTDCFDCPFMPRRWTVTISGVESGICPDCSLINGTWILERVSYAGGCIWSADHAACGDAPGVINAVRFYRWAGFTYLFINALSAYIAKYRPQGVFDCHGSNTFELFQTSLHCTHWPATLVMEPVEE